MPQVDTSIYRTSAPANPLATVGSAASTINALNENKLFGQTFGARQAIGDAYQNSIDPTTGQLDTNKLLANVAHDPRAAFMAGDVAQQALARQQAQLNIKTQQLNLGLTHAKAMSGFFGQLAANPNLSMKDITSAATEMVSEGLISPQEAAAEFPNVPSDSAGMKAWALQHYQRYMAMQGQLQAALPKPQVVNAGGQQVVIDTNALTNPNITGTRIVNSLSPGEAATPTPVLIRNADGTYSPSSVPRSEYLSMSRQGPVATGVPLTRAGLTPSEASTPVPVFENGQPGIMPREQFAENGLAHAQVSPANAAAIEGRPALGPLRLPNNPPSILNQPTSAPTQAAPAPQGTAPAAQPPGNGFVPTGPQLGAESAANAAGTSSGEALGDAQKEAAAFPSRMFQLTQALHSLQGTTTGPGTATTNLVKSFISAQSPEFLKSLGLNPDVSNIKNYDEANKYLTQYAMAQAGAMGQGTDEKLATAITGNANTHINNLAAQDVVKANMSLERMRQAGVLAFQQSGAGPQDFNKWMTSWASGMDPRAFALDQLAPKQRQQLLAEIAKAPALERQRFGNSYNLAVKEHLLPDLAAPSAAQ